MSTCKIYFKANTLLTQHLKIVNPKYTPEDIVKGLQDKTLLTTIGHSLGFTETIINASCPHEDVAHIVQQNVIDLECTDFKPLGDS